MEVFVHKRGAEVAVVEVEETIKVGELVERVDGADGHVWLEEQDEELDLDATLAAVEIVDRSHVHVGRCTKVAVEVRFNNETKTYDVPPATTLNSVFERAASAGEGFGLSEADKDHYTLQVQGTTDQPDRSRHVGEFAGDDCTAKFDLVMEGRFQG